MIDRLHSAGIALAGIDVGESYGSPKGVNVYQAFYKEMTGKRGFRVASCSVGPQSGWVDALQLGGVSCQLCWRCRGYLSCL